MSSATPVNPPGVITEAATNVASNTATLNGSGDPNGSETFGHFRYSTGNPGNCSDDFGTRVPSSSEFDIPLGAGTGSIPFSINVTRLLPGTMYYLCAIANNSGGASYGSVLTLQTFAMLPTVTTNEASAVSGTQAQLNGTGNPNGGSGTGWFRYSTADPGTCSDSFGTRAPLFGGVYIGIGSVVTPYSAVATDLIPGTTYYFCAIAINQIGFGFGPALSFTTPSPPSVITEPATAVTSTTSQLNGSANPNSAVTASWFRYATTNPGVCNDSFGTRSPSAGGISLGNGSSIQPFSQTISGLAAGTTYYFCAIASNLEGTTFGDLLSFTTTNSAPIVNGTVIYGNAVGSPSVRYISSATISANGSPAIMTTTAAPGPNAGRYSLTGFGSGAYTITPSKTGGVNGITSFDSAKVAQHVSGAAILTGNQLLAADVSNNGTVSSFDAAQLARYVSSSPPYGITGTWKFIPATRFYSSVTGDLVGEDYIAILMGDVSGNWTNTGARPANAFDPNALSWLIGGGF